jgi:hypothetical protein
MAELDRYLVQKDRVIENYIEEFGYDRIADRIMVSDKE